MEEKYVINRRTGKIIASGRGKAGLILNIKKEIDLIGSGPGKQVSISLIEKKSGERIIVIEKPEDEK